jgi:2-isopropylmalate synthase
MTHDEKLEIAELLDEMGVDIIEAGFPIASEGDFRAVSEIAKLAKSVICGLARANLKDIDRCWEAVRHARSAAHPHLHRHLAAAPRHPEPDHGRDGRAHPRDGDPCPQPLRQRAVVADGRHADGVGLPQARVVEIAIKAGATTINIPDTVGYTAPVESPT